MTLFENCHRYYDPSIGRYLSPEPLASRKPLAAQNNAYSYAGSNPIVSIDPTGLYRINSDNLEKCPNWYAALRKARQWAGCEADANQCKCLGEIGGCHPTCNICDILDPGMGPEAFVKDLGGESSKGNVLHGESVPAWWPADEEVRFDAYECTSICSIDVLAGTMLHEAIHFCEFRDGKAFPEGDTEHCSQEAIVDRCKKW